MNEEQIKQELCTNSTMKAKFNHSNEKKKKKKMVDCILSECNDRNKVRGSICHSFPSVVQLCK
jgi:hypothetical protein